MLVLPVPPRGVDCSAESVSEGREAVVPTADEFLPRLMSLISVNEGWWQDGLFVVVWAEGRPSPLTRGDKGVGR